MSATRLLILTALLLAAPLPAALPAAAAPDQVKLCFTNMTPAPAQYRFYYHWSNPDVSQGLAQGLAQQFGSGRTGSGDRPLAPGQTECASVEHVDYGVMAIVFSTGQQCRHDLRTPAGDIRLTARGTASAPDCSIG